MFATRFARPAIRLALASTLLLAGGVGCDGNSSPGLDAPLTADELMALCADPAASVGQTLIIPGEALEARTECTAMGCGGASCCGNACWTKYVVPCADGTVDDLVLVRVGPDVTAVTPPTDGAANLQIQGLVKNTALTFGCAGVECHEVCVPGPLSQLASVTGVVAVADGGDKWVIEVSTTETTTR